MRLSRNSQRLLLAAALCIGCTCTAWAEVSVDLHGGRVATFVTGITDGPDPVGSDVWAVIRPLPEQILNADGHLRGDGRPDIAYDPVTGWPFVVWAYNTGLDHDIAFAEWTGEGWSPIQFLTSGLEDDLDPRIYREADGSIQVVWWCRDSAWDRVFIASRDANSNTWSLPLLVADAARRPSVVRHLGDLHIMFERPSAEPDQAQDLVVARQDGDGGFFFFVVGSTTRTQRLDPVLHSSPGRLWGEWKHFDGEFGVVESDGTGWSSPQTHPWLDTSWIGVEETRILIRNEILQQPR